MEWWTEGRRACEWGETERGRNGRGEREVEPRGEGADDSLSNQSYAVERTKMYYVKNYAYALLSEYMVVAYELTAAIGVLCFYSESSVGTPSAAVRADQTADQAHHSAKPFSSTSSCSQQRNPLTLANRHMATSKICQFLATVVSIGASTRVIWLINKASYLAVMQQVSFVSSISALPFRALGLPPLELAWSPPLTAGTGVWHDLDHIHRHAPSRPRPDLTRGVVCVGALLWLQPHSLGWSVLAS